jgi:subtilisin family serine protease
VRIRTLAAVPAALAALAFAATPGQATPATTVTASSYIVVLRDGTSVTPDAAARYAASLGAQVSYVYKHALHGYAAVMTPSAAEIVSASPAVAYVEHDGVVTGDTTQLNPQNWGIDRIDQRNLPLSASYTYTATGSGVKAYIIDSGIRTTHTQFGGRAISGYDAVDGGPADDCNGHGTHVAGTVGGSSIGVARGVTLVAVRVLGCSNSGATSGVIAGVDWATGNHVAGQAAVANMSLGGGIYAPLDTAVQNLVNDGVTVAVAAGNGNTAGVRQNACNYSPAHITAAITVGAVNSSDQAASFSNYGTCVDLLAPGVQIISSWYTSDTAGAYLDGTSQATPHVAGVAALYLQGNPGASPATVASAITANATTNVISNVGTGTPNRLLFTNY